MGLTKQYLRYAASGLFNVIGSSKANVVFVKFKGVQGKLCAVGACEHVLIWDLRKGEKVQVKNVYRPWKWTAPNILHTYTQAHLNIKGDGH